MANQNFVRGALIRNDLCMSPYSGMTKTYAIADTDNVAMFIGDFVKPTGESATVNGISYPVVTQAAATNTICGIATGFSFIPTNPTLIYRLASTLRLVTVNIDPFVVFEIQMNGTPASGDVDNNMDIVVAAGNTVNSLSGMQLDRSTIGAGSGQVRVLRLSPSEDNAWGQYAKVIGMINEHSYKGTVGV